MRRSIVVFLTAGSLIAAAACSKPAVGTDPLARPPGEVHLYGSDGNMMNAVGELLVDHPDALAGMKGTTPLSRLSQSFRDRLRGVDSQLKDDSYSGESYDAVVISALAAQIARSTNPKAIAAQINGVTTGGTPCETPAACLGLIQAGKDIMYTGVTLGLGGV